MNNNEEFETLETPITYANIENAYEKEYRKQIFESGEDSDITFLVGSREIRMFKAHKCLLIASSQKFRDILKQHNIYEPIMMPEIEPDTFEQVLR